MPVLGWTCDGTKSTAEARAISLSAIDFSRDAEGKVYLGYDQQFHTWVPKGPGLSLLSQESVPGTVASGLSVAKVKYRNGQFWVKDQDNTRVLQWDARVKTWRVSLDPGYGFQDFEVSFHGQIVLIGTSRPKEGEKKGEKHLIECFEIGSKSPVSVENYPPSGLSREDEACFPFTWGVPVSCASDEFIVCYYAMAGRLFAYDTHKRSLREITTPWKPLSSEWVRAQDRDFGVMNLIAYPGPRCLQFVPTPSRNSVGIAYQIPGKAPRKNVLVQGKEEEIPVGEDKDPEPVKVAELDFVAMKLEPLASDVAPKLPVWLKPNGTYGPIAEVLKSTERTSAPAKDKPQAKPKATGIGRISHQP